MARIRNLGSVTAVETIRNRLQLSQSEFSRALGYGDSAYGDMVRKGEISQTVALAAEALMRRQAPGTEAELAFIVRIVKGTPLVTELGDLKSLVLDEQRYLLVPADQPRPKPVREAHVGNGAASPSEHPGTQLPV